MMYRSVDRMDEAKLPLFVMTLTNFLATLAETIAW